MDAICRRSLKIDQGNQPPLLNTPFTLWGLLWDLHAHHYEPGRFSPLLAWMRLLDGGGRLLLGMLGAAAVIALAARFCTPARQTGAAAAP